MGVDPEDEAAVYGFIRTTGIFIIVFYIVSLIIS
jgi:hypothetical protein